MITKDTGIPTSYMNKNITLFTGDEYHNFLNSVIDEINKNTSKILITPDHKETLESFSYFIKYLYAFSVVLGEKMNEIDKLKKNNNKLEESLNLSIKNNEALLKIINNIIGQDNTIKILDNITGQNNKTKNLIDEYNSIIPIIMDQIYANIYKKAYKSFSNEKKKPSEEERLKNDIKILKDNFSILMKENNSLVDSFNIANRRRKLLLDENLELKTKLNEYEKTFKLLKEEILKFKNGEQADFFPYIEADIVKNKDTIIADLRLNKSSLDIINNTANQEILVELERLKGENERLKGENERLKGENEKLKTNSNEKDKIILSLETSYNELVDKINSNINGMPNINNILYSINGFKKAE